MRHFLIIGVFVLVSNIAQAYNPMWTHTDKKLISFLTKLDKENPKEAEAFFKTQKFQKIEFRKENLGFGWTMWTPGIGGGYISISAKFYYYKDSLISYSLTPQLPTEKRLQKRYKKWYGNYFTYSKADIQTLNFNLPAILRPLQAYEGILKIIPERIVQYMTPNSGTMYGYFGGGAIMPNRQAFLDIRDSLTTEDVILIMYSINPASRLTAIEYYWKHKDRFSVNDKIDNWIGLVFKETPIIKSMSGCFFVTEEAKSFVTMHLFWTDK